MEIKRRFQSVLFLGYIYIFCKCYFRGIDAIAGSYNIALRKPTKQGPRNFGNHVSALAVDGDLGQDTFAGDCSHTQDSSTSTGSWWSVEFQGNYYISLIRILRRNDVTRTFIRDRMAGCSIKGLPGNQEIYNEDQSGLLYIQPDINISIPISLRNIRFSGIKISIPGEYLTLCEVQVFLALNCTLPILNNGTITWPDDLSASDVLPLGATATYICNAGFTPYIQRNLTCGMNGLRDESNNPPRCSARSCGAIVINPPVSNGDWQSSAANIDDADGNCLYHLCAYTYNCQKGYIESAAKPITTTCNANGVWTNPEGTCKAIDCSAQIQNETNYTVANLLEIYTYTMQLTAECLEGYELSSGNLNRICLETGTWSGLEPMCTIVSCTLPVEDATLETELRPSGSAPIYGSIVESVCIRGYKHVSGNLTRQCQADRSWSGTRPVCNVRQCSQPKSIANGGYFQISNNGTEEKLKVDLNDKFDFDTALIFKCDDGFNLSHQYIRQRECLENETWSEVEPKCTGNIVTPPLNNPESLSTGLTAVTGGFIGAGTVIIILIISAGTVVLLRRKRRNSNTDSPYETILSSTPTPYSTLEETIRTEPDTGGSETKYISAANRDTKCEEEITDKSKVYENLKIEDASTDAVVNRDTKCYEDV